MTGKLARALRKVAHHQAIKDALTQEDERYLYQRLKGAYKRKRVLPPNA